MNKAIALKAEDVVIAKRGRKVQLNDELSADLKVLVKNSTKILDLSPYFGRDATTDPKAKAKAGANIRKHWKHLGRDSEALRLDFSPNGQIVARRRPEAEVEAPVEPTA